MLPTTEYRDRDVPLDNKNGKQKQNRAKEKKKYNKII